MVCAPEKSRSASSDISAILMVELSMTNERQLSESRAGKAND